MLGASQESVREGGASSLTSRSQAFAGTHFLLPDSFQPVFLISVVGSEFFGLDWPPWVVLAKRHNAPVDTLCLSIPVFCLDEEGVEQETGVVRKYQSILLMSLKKRAPPSPAWRSKTRS